MIELHNVTKYYPVNGGRRYILKNVSLVIPTDTNIAILGPNGAGKSTLLRLIGGAESANSGKVTTDCDVSWPLGLASGFQGSLTGRENVMFVCRINGLNRSEIQIVINNVIEFTELGAYFEMPVNTYSSGMRARLTFGLSMSFRFDVYLIDELTSVGDMIFREKAKKAFEELKQRASLVFVSHNMKTLKESCESALLLRDGKADYFEDINEAIAEYTRYVNPGKKSVVRARKAVKRVAKKATKKVAKKATKKVANKTLDIIDEIKNPRTTG
ncbi:ABC transporter ATP-binding protein [Luteolibacter sp. AS25]